MLATHRVRHRINRFWAEKAGFSMGGFFTNTLACDHGDWFRGFAPIAGGGPTACADGVESAIMIHHGTADDIVDISRLDGAAFERRAPRW